MCWWLIVLGALMTLAGLASIVRFFAGRGEKRPDHASDARVEAMVLGVLLACVGPLLFYLGLLDAVCRALGIR